MLFRSINVLKDDYPVLFASGQSLVADTAYYGNIESTITFILEDLNLTDDPAEITSDALQLNLTSNMAGGVSVIMYEVIEFNVDKTSISVASYKKFATAKLGKNTAATQVQAVLVGTATPKVIAS